MLFMANVAPDIYFRYMITKTAMHHIEIIT